MPARKAPHDAVRRFFISAPAPGGEIDRRPGACSTSIGKGPYALKHPVRILLHRRHLLAAGTFWYLSRASVGASAARLKPPIYPVERIDKVCSLSFNATQGNEDTHTPIHILGRYDVKAPFSWW